MSEPSERAIIRQHSKSFALAARLLAPEVRRHAERLYAWCRYADDAIDHAPTPQAGVVALANLRAELDAIYAGGTPTTTAGHMLKAVAEEIRLPRDYPEELLKGMSMDAAGQRYATFDDLLLYCHRVAGVVGHMMCHAMGVTDDLAAVHAGHLGVAMQLTNIARDVAEDWAKGRLYVPIEWLGGEPPAGQALDDSVVAPQIRRLLDAAEGYYCSGDAGLGYLDRRSRLAVRTARAVYSAIAAEVRRRGCRPSAGRAVTSKATKVQAVLTSAWQTAIERPLRQRVARPVRVFGLEPLTRREPSILLTP